VEWVNDGGRHSVEADDGSFKSETLKQGDKFEHKFDKPGRYAYHCEFHGEKGGKDMAGTIIVRK
jgi:plastocyanin